MLCLTISQVIRASSIIPPLQKQKNLRELELIIQDAILLSVRDSMPIENILRAYLDETVEHDVSQEVIEEKIEVTEDKNIEDKKDDKSDENQLLEILKPLMNSKSVWNAHGLNLMAEYFYSKKEKLKAKEFFNKIIVLENASQELKIEAQKRLNRDLSD